MKISISLLTVISLVGCQKERQTNYYAYLKNTTTHKIVVKPFSQGNINTNNVIVLSSNEIKKIAEGTDRGFANKSGFTSQYFSNADSIQVIFDDLYSITHYFNSPSSLAKRYYNYSSLRNLGNYLSYAYTSSKISKNIQEDKYNYEFTEQDYNDAK